jgi:hypothetical protein
MSRALDKLADLQYAIQNLEEKKAYWKDAAHLTERTLVDALAYADGLFRKNKALQAELDALKRLPYTPAVGDYVKVIEGKHGNGHEGNCGFISYIKFNDIYVKFVNEKGRTETCIARKVERAVEPQPVAAEEPSVYTPKVGDYVEIVTCTLHDPDHVGKKGYLSSLPALHRKSYLVFSSPGLQVENLDDWCCSAKVIKSASRREIKVGDKVKVLKCAYSYPDHIGAIGELMYRHRPESVSSSAGWTVCFPPDNAVCEASEVELIG